MSTQNTDTELNGKAAAGPDNIQFLCIKVFRQFF